MHINMHTHARVDCMMEWLLSLGIGENLATSYHRTFSEELVDQVSLKLMCQDDLKALGVAALGHRVLIHCAATTGRDHYNHTRHVKNV